MGIDYIIKYKVRAVDTQNKYSVFCDSIEVPVEAIRKISVPVDAVENYELFSNYPNPFNPSTAISYAVKEAGLVKLKVFDMLGAEVADLVNENKETGIYKVDFNAANLPSGVYIYTLHVNGFTSSKKMILLK